ncbi:hypothetical protein HDU93_001675 [Gonapodya sp. JEL0774]|nr:hypothetical protein HDU93_001675 [Gonapodya sp. JEL0774]
MSLTYFSSHGYLRLASHVDRTGDPLEPFTRSQYQTAKTTRAESEARAQAAYEATGDAMWKEFLTAAGKGLVSAEELYKLNVERNGVWKEWLEAWEGTKHHPKNPTGLPMDAIICEVQTLPAVPEWKSLEAPCNFTGTVLYNILDYPGGSIPVTTVDPSIDGPYTTKPRWTGEAMVHKVWNENRNTMKGAPVGVQVVGRRREEEKTLEVMEEVERCLKVVAERGGEGKGRL